MISYLRKQPNNLHNIYRVKSCNMSENPESNSPWIQYEHCERRIQQIFSHPQRFLLCDPNGAFTVSCWSVNSGCDESQMFVSLREPSAKSPHRSDPSACVPGGIDPWIWTTRMMNGCEKEKTNPTCESHK